MGTILTFHLNHFSSLLIYRYSILHISLKFGVEVYRKNRLHAIAFLAISGNKCCHGNTFYVSWSCTFVGIYIIPKFHFMFISRGTCDLV